jgi:hypothetical protein
MSTLRLRSVAFAAQTLTIPVPKNRRPKFDLHLRVSRPSSPGATTLN